MDPLLEKMQAGAATVPPGYQLSPPSGPSQEHFLYVRGNRTPILSIEKRKGQWEVRRANAAGGSYDAILSDGNLQKAVRGAVHWHQMRQSRRNMRARKVNERIRAGVLTTDSFFEGKAASKPWSAMQKRAEQEEKKAERARKAQDWANAATHYDNAAKLLRKTLDQMPSMYVEKQTKRLRDRETLCLKLAKGAAKLAGDPKLAAQMARKYR